MANGMLWKVNDWKARISMRGCYHGVFVMASVRPSNRASIRILSRLPPRVQKGVPPGGLLLRVSSIRATSGISCRLYLWGCRGYDYDCSKEVVLW